MNMTPDEPAKPPADGAEFFNPPALRVPADDAHLVEQLSENIARLERDLSAERDARREDKFYTFCAAIVPVNVIIYTALEAWFPFFVLFVFQIVMLWGYAKHLGVDWAVQSLGWFLHWLSTRFKGEPKKP